MIDVTGISKAKLLAVLHAGSRARGLQGQRAMGRLSEAECSDYIGRARKGERIYFDTLCGRMMGVDVGGDRICEQAYDRDNGAGAAGRVVGELRREQGDGE